MNWLDVESLAQQTVELGWEEGKRRLPRRVTTAIRRAAEAAPLPTPTAPELATVQRGNRIRVGLWGILGAAVFGRGLYVQAKVGVWIAFVLVGVLVIVLGYVAWSKWKSDPQNLYAKRERRRLRKAAAIQVRSRAAQIKRATIPVTSVPPASGLMTPRDAEHLAAQIMTNLGAKNVRVTQATRDGGLDVEADGFVAEVKHYADAVPAAPVHRIFGVAQSRGARALFFTLTGYRPEAVAFAENAGVALFTYDPTTGAVAGHSSTARAALQDGL